MPYSIPFFMNFILSNGSGSFVGLFRLQSKNDVNGSTNTEYYYLRTDAGGAPINVGTNPVSRQNAVNGFFDELEDAMDVANYPSGYGSYTDDFLTRKIFGYLQQFPYDGGDTTAIQTKEEYTEAYARGVTDFVIKLEWGATFRNPTEQTTNADSSWANSDDLTDYILDLGDDTTVSYRMCTDMDDGILYAGTSFYKLWDDQMQNELGFPARIQDGSGHVSLAYSDGVDLALDFIEKALTRYWDRTGGRMLWYSIGMTAQNEAGYNYENQNYQPVSGAGVVSTVSGTGNTNLSGSGTTFLTTFSENSPIVINGERVIVTAITSDTLMSTTATTNVYTNAGYQYYGDRNNLYPSSFDYTKHNQDGFRNAMQTKYGTIGDLNTSWGESNANFSTVFPPDSNSVTAGDRTTENLCAVFSNNKGKDWWQYNYELIKGYLESARQLGVDNAPGAKFCLEWGSCVDILSPLRGSLMICEMSDYSDMMKCQLGKLNINGNLSLSMDTISPNYSGKIGTELNDYDATAIYGATSPSQIEDYMTQIGIGAIQGGATYILIISDLKNAPNFSAMMNVLTNVKNYMNTYNGTISYANTVEFSIGQQLANPNYLLNAWQGAGGSNTNRIKMLQSNDYGFGGNSEGCAFPLSIYANLHSYCLYSNAIKSYQYTNAESAGDSATLAYLNANFIRFLVPTHSITYVGTDLAKANWHLVGATDGIIYISNVQKLGWFRVPPDPNGNQPAENNNHPDRRYIMTQAEDSVYYLPKGQNYIIYMTNIGPANLAFLVHILNTGFGGDQDTILLKRKKLTVGMAEQSYTIDTSNIPNTQIPQIKINCNRDFNTDTDADYQL